MQLKSRRTVGYLALVLVAAGLVLWVASEKDTDRQMKRAEITEQKEASPATTTSRVASPLVKVSDTEGIDRNIYSDKIRAFQDQQVKRNKPLQMFARIVDQHDQPVAGATVRFDIAYIPLLTAPGMGWASKYHEITSDDDGRFSVENQNGVFINVLSIERQGYKVENGGGRTLWAEKSAELSAQNPLIIHAWKIEPPKTRVREDYIEVRFKPDGQFVSIDFDRALHDKVITTGPPVGDLYVSVLTSQPDESGYFDWTVHVQAIGGGLRELDQTDPFPYLAPEDGYVPQWSHSRTHAYTDDARGVFFVKSRDGGRYSKVRFRILPPRRGGDGNAYAEIIYTTNLDGARELPEQR